MMVLTPYIAVCFAKFFKPIVVQAEPDNSKIQYSKFKVASKPQTEAACRLCCGGATKGRPSGLAKIHGCE